MMLQLDLHIYKFKNICIVLILQNIPQLPCITTANTVLICEHLWKQELEHKEKQENECRHYWETITLYARIHYKLIKDKLIKLSLLTSVLCCSNHPYATKQLSHRQQHKPHPSWHLGAVAFVQGQEAWRIISLGPERSQSQRQVFGFLISIKSYHTHVGYQFLSDRAAHVFSEMQDSLEHGAQGRIPSAQVQWQPCL